MPNANPHALDFLDDDHVRETARGGRSPEGTRTNLSTVSTQISEITGRVAAVESGLSELNRNTGGMKKFLYALLVVGLSSPVIVGVLSRSSNSSESKDVAAVTSGMKPEAENPSSSTAPVPSAAVAPTDTAAITASIRGAVNVDTLHSSTAALSRMTGLNAVDQNALEELIGEREIALGTAAANARVAIINAQITQLSTTDIAALGTAIVTVQKTVTDLTPQTAGTDAFITIAQRNELNQKINDVLTQISTERTAQIKERLKTVDTTAGLQAIKDEIDVLARVLGLRFFHQAVFANGLRDAETRIQDTLARRFGVATIARSDAEKNIIEAAIPLVLKSTDNWEFVLRQLRARVQRNSELNPHFEVVHKENLLRLIDARSTAIRAEITADEARNAGIRAETERLLGVTASDRIVAEMRNLSDVHQQAIYDFLRRSVPGSTNLPSSSERDELIRVTGLAETSQIVITLRHRIR